MPYGDLAAEELQRFATYKDLDEQRCTIEEREEYEPHIDRGNVVFAGVDYGKILSAAERESDIIIWDGGNNDLPFYMPDLHIVVTDPLRPGNEIGYYPGEANVRMADVVILNKVGSADPASVESVRRNVRQLNAHVPIIEATSSVRLDDPSHVKGKRVLVVEDGPTVTHGDMAYGAGLVAAREYGAKAIVDPRPFAIGSIKEVFEKYGHLGPVLPAMGYGGRQIKELELTIQRVDCEAVVLATPTDIRRIIRLEKPVARVSYEIEERTRPTLEEILSRKFSLQSS
jgi:predicted GTPase